MQGVTGRKLGEKLLHVQPTLSGDQLTYPELDEIETQHQSDDSRLRAVIECWLQGDGRDKKPSWRRIIWALDDISDTTATAAENIRHLAEPLPG